MSSALSSASDAVTAAQRDLAANVWTNPGAVSGCPAGTHGRNVRAGTCDPMDDETVFGGHGTQTVRMLRDWVDLGRRRGVPTDELERLLDRLTPVAEVTG